MNYSTPVGFRDILPEESGLREECINKVQVAFAEEGYALIETPTLEALDVMQVGGRMPTTPFKFFDAQGDLLVMRPDVTQQVARICGTRLKDRPGPFRFRYTQRVFRESNIQMQAAVREMTQIGIENIGEVGARIDAEILALFARALELCGLKNYTLAIATVGVFRELLEKSGVGEDLGARLVRAYHASNFVELNELLTESKMAPLYAEALRQLPTIRGGVEAIAEVRRMVEPLGCVDGLDDLEESYAFLEGKGLAKNILVDFSVMSSFDYYTGLVVEAYAPGLGTPLGGGGRYDNMLAAYGPERPATGFAFYLDRVMAAALCRSAASDASAVATPSAPISTTAIAQKPLRIAIPKGTLYKESVALLAQAGLDTTGLDDPGRHLIIRNPRVEYVIVRPTDAPVFVALGAADCGICGKDSLLESKPSVVELVDLAFGGCRFVVAEPVGAHQETEGYYQKAGSLRVATKYPNITSSYYAERGVQIELVKLHGNVELAPLTGMAERVVDITSSGRTLRENNLCVVDEVLSSTARFFANNSAFRTDSRIMELSKVLLENARQDAR